MKQPVGMVMKAADDWKSVSLMLWESFLFFIKSYICIRRFNNAYSTSDRFNNAMVLMGVVTILYTNEDVKKKKNGYNSVA